MNSINSTSAAGGGSGGGSTERGGSASAARHHHSQIIASESGDTENLLEDMWAKADQDIKRINTQLENWKIQTLPLARVKKIMKSEEFVMQELEKDRCAREGLDLDEKNLAKFMISAEAPLVMSKACELLVRELTVRAWKHTARNRRRTLQRQDIHAAVGDSDVFDFLIDLVPRVANRADGHIKPPPLVVQNMIAPPPPVQLTSLLRQAQASGIGAPDLASILDQRHHHHQLVQPEQLMLGFPTDLSAPMSSNIDENNGQHYQQQHNNNNSNATQIHMQQLQTAAATASSRATSTEYNRRPQWSGP